MFSKLFVAIVCASAALAGPFKRTSNLSVNVAAPSTDVTLLDNLKLTASVTNNGLESVKILKYGTILDDGLPTQSFGVTKEGAEVPFTGIRVQVSLTDADDSAYVVIPAGETVTVSHDVSSLFDFESAGAGAFTFEPRTNFQIAAESEEVAAAFIEHDAIQVTANKVDIHLSGELSKRELKLNKRTRDTCTNASQKSFIDAAYSEARTLASRAASYISSNGADSLFTSYYKTTSTTTVRNVFTNVANENSSTRTLGCADTLGACTSGVIAYTIVSNTNMVVCSIFFNEVADSNLCRGTSVASRNARGGTILHELTHATSGTSDIIYGCSSDQGLSASNAARNADNYNCFSTQVFANTGC
ncbi:hypothetical protein D9758_011964 [Tetrapyrgos nigripes]|uniref:Neutral protease 2 n=1 Tax=Tetrapyrgos nigripes TaxID=182062 RepID=A0A8H5D288_9AGAR|nr:hypothetical protein D9758_011964 [Tetrapyrgos nigripes]